MSITNFLINLLVSALAVFLVANALPEVAVESFWTAILVALVLGLINAIIKPIVVVLTLPINILTLGLFTFIINALLILLAAAVVPGFVVNGILWALVFSVLVSIVSSLISMILPD